MGKGQARTQATDHRASSPLQPRCCPGTAPVQLQSNPGRAHRYRPGTARNSSASNPVPARCRLRNKPSAFTWPVSPRHGPGTASVQQLYNWEQPRYSPSTAPVESRCRLGIAPKQHRCTSPQHPRCYIGTGPVQPRHKPGIALVASNRNFLHAGGCVWRKVFPPCLGICALHAGGLFS